MIEREILDVIGDSEDEGNRINQIADEFRRGRDPEELIDLLDSDNEELVAAGVWILEEIPPSIYNSTHFMDRLKSLMKHESAMVRFYAIGALFPAVDASSKKLLAELQNDSNEGVRKKARAAMGRLETER